MLNIIPAANYKRPVTGEFVRMSQYAPGTCVRTDHRDVKIISEGVHPQFGPYVCTTCEIREGTVKSTTYADKDGDYPQFLPTAPNGPYGDSIHQERWRAGYHD